MKMNLNVYCKKTTLLIFGLLSISSVYGEAEDVSGYLKEGKLEQAQAEISSLVDSPEKRLFQVELDLAQGDRCFKARDLSCAKKYYETVLHAWPGNDHARRQLEAIHLYKAPTPVIKKVVSKSTLSLQEQKPETIVKVIVEDKRSVEGDAGKNLTSLAVFAVAIFSGLQTLLLALFVWRFRLK